MWWYNGPKWLQKSKLKTKKCLPEGVLHFNKWWLLTFENKQMSLSTNEDICICMKSKLVWESGPRGCCSIMDPMNNCSKMLTPDSGPMECYDITASSDVKIFRVAHMYLNDFLKMGVASKWVKPRLQNFLCFLSIIMANFSENLVTIASIFPLSMALLDQGYWSPYIGMA